jgi:hypothetical protein
MNDTTTTCGAVTRTAKTITLAQLSQLGACEDQLNKFQELFGESVILTPALAAYAAEFDWDWAAWRLLPDAFNEYWHMTAPARGEFQCDIAPGWADYQRVKAETFLRLAILCESWEPEEERASEAAWREA